MPRFRYVRRTPDELATGRPLALGDEVELTAEEVELNARLFHLDALLALPGDEADKPKPKPEKETNP